ncbi:MAG: multicopper oxidase domain-containing protein [Ilumatobacter sp.]|nr:multicopper oxidase domain-containing protein [Ilumatobacter sp.]MDG2040682.1 multicopper oxidase domain-containing protein [Ilumatobacter sp.]
MSVIDQPASATVPPTPRPDDSSGSLLSSSLFALGVLGILGLITGLIALAFVALVRDNNGSGGADMTSSALDISLSEFAIDGELRAPAGDVTLNIVNAGAIEHNIAVRNLGVQSNNLQSRGVDTLALGELKPGTYELYCAIAGHAESGMVAELEIGETDEFEPADLAGEHPGFTAEEIDQLMVDSMLAFPAETKGLGNQLLEPEILADGTKRFELTAEVIPWEVSPGEFVEAWAYNGQVPGPYIKLDVGDRVQIELTNLTPMGTDIHWHGIHTPNDQDGVSPYTQDPIGTGETFTYEFDAEDPAIGMYHAHLHSQTSVINGMFAAFQIGDNPLPYGKTISGVTIPQDLEPAFETPMVLNDAGTIGLTLNGKSFPATEPIVIDENEWGVIHYYNEGLTAHPMHLHQFPQLVYAKDGIPLDNPYWADTINVAPGERYSVLFNADTVGTWVFHCHILTHVERTEGMFGMVTAMIVNPKP